MLLIGLSYNRGLEANDKLYYFFIRNFWQFNLGNASIAQDWANLGKYKTANKQLMKPKINQHRIVFMGNSITEGWSQANPSFFEGKPYINRGIGGQTTPQMLLRFRQDVIDLEPKIVVILAGTNDIAENTGPITLEQIHDNIQSMVELAKANSENELKNSSRLLSLCSAIKSLSFCWSGS